MISKIIIFSIGFILGYFINILAYKIILKYNHTIDIKYNSLILNGIIFLLISYSNKLSVYYIVDLLIIEILYLISIVDSKIYIVPNKLSILLLTLTIIKLIQNNRNPIILIITILIFIFFTTSYKLYKNKIGMGDLKLFLILLIYWDIKLFLINFTITFILASIISIFKIILKKIHLKDKLAFAPYIFWGFLVTFIFGNKIYLEYTKFICG